MSVDRGRSKQLYFDMLRIRRIEERIADLYPQQEMRCPVHLSIGQEAVSVGVSAALSRDDLVLGGHRSHGHYLAKGGDLRAMLAELYGKRAGCAGGHGGSMHLVDPAVGFLGATAIVASAIPIAVGTALASVMRGEPLVSVVFFGEGAVEEGVFLESLNFAALKGLPVLFVCENNLYSVYSPLEVRQPPGRDIIALARAIGVEGSKDDGNDVHAVHRLAAAAVDRARRGGGPTILELMTYRWREHCGPSYDNSLGYRSEAEFEEWKRRCPIARLGARLLAEGALTPPEIATMEERIRDEIEDAVRFAQESPFPDEGRLFEDVHPPEGASVPGGGSAR
jgi:TPP-dependent pyruvate/acetoin dehydrogenase alpha subunit